MVLPGKWTMMIIEVLTERGELRFTRLSEMVPGISYKMLTRLTGLGLSLSAAFCGVWLWAADHEFHPTIAF
jgi:hypothetical protein